MPDSAYTHPVRTSRVVKTIEIPARICSEHMTYSVPKPETLEEKKMLKRARLCRKTDDDDEDDDKRIFI